MYRARFVGVFVATFTAGLLAFGGALVPFAYAQANVCAPADFSCHVTSAPPYYRVGPCTCTASGIPITGVCVAINTCKGTPTPQPPVSGAAEPPTTLQTIGHQLDAAGNAISGAIEPVTSFASKYPFTTMIGMMVGMQLLNNALTPGAPKGGGGVPNGQPTAGYCTTQQYYTSDPLASQTDPCAIYNPNNSTGGACRGTPYFTSDVNALRDPCATYRPSSTSGTCTSVRYHTNDITALSDPCAIYDAPTSIGSTTITTPRVSTTTCPAYLVEPDCGTGMVARDNGYDSNGCRLPTTCVVSTAVTTGQTDTPITVNTGGTTTDTGTPVPISEVLNSTVYYDDQTSSNTPDPSQTPLNRKDTPLPANGLHGDIRSFGKGATIYANSRNGNTEVAGFYGSSSTAGRLCQTRPWSSNFLSYVIPSAFFDNLCSWGGYPTGQGGAGGVSSGGGVGLTPTRTTSVGSPVPTATVPANSFPQPAAKIWARPANVNIGGRTTIFWVSQNVTACTESSSDGNFSGSSTSGGASTVALSGPVTFMMQCRALDGSMISSSVTVGIGI